MKSTSKNGPSASSNGLRGARDESSVLFSLHALMAKGDGEAPDAARRDESGLIDIKALAAAAKDPVRTASPPEVHLDIFPFEAPPPPAPVTEAAPVEAIGELPAKTTSRRTLMIAGALLIGAAAAAIGLTLSAPGTPALAAADNVGAVAEAARQGTAAIPPPAPPSQPEAKSVPQNPSRPDARPQPQRIPGTPTPATPQSTPTAKKVDVKPPVADPCGGDLMCAMRRAAEKKR
jgi:hypothetical protein